MLPYLTVKLFFKQSNRIYCAENNVAGALKPVRKLKHIKLTDTLH